jgi:hypothetical protein
MSPRKRALKESRPMKGIAKLILAAAALVPMVACRILVEQ